MPLSGALVILKVSDNHHYHYYHRTHTHKHTHILTRHHHHPTGNAWHHSFPPFAIDELARLHGSRDKLGEKIMQMVNIPSNFNPGEFFVCVVCVV